MTHNSLASLLYKVLDGFIQAAVVQKCLDGIGKIMVGMRKYIVIKFMRSYGQDDCWLFY